MGGGNYSYARSMSMAQDYSKQDREEVFSQRYISWVESLMSLSQKVSLN